MKNIKFWLLCVAIALSAALVTECRQNSRLKNELSLKSTRDSLVIDSLQNQNQFEPQNLERSSDVDLDTAGWLSEHSEIKPDSD